MPKRSPTKKQNLTKVEPIEPVIRVVRGQRVVLDADLAEIYGVTTKRLNEQINLFAQMKDLLRPAPPQPEPKRRRIGF
jgi:hypothetical protein